MKMGLKKQKKRNDHMDMELSSAQESMEANNMEQGGTGKENRKFGCCR